MSRLPPTSPIADATFRRLFGAQLASLLGTGLTTVALTLLAYDLASDNAGTVVGVALALKMVAYVFLAPTITALAGGIDRRRLLVSLDLLRAAIVLMMPFVTEVWQVFVLIFVLNAASAGFTPTFQATIPDILRDEEQYTRALVLSRIAYEIEALASPAIAAALLAFISYQGLFVGNAAGFLVSAALVLSTTLPARTRPDSRRTWDAITRGVRRFIAIPALRGVFALNLAVAAASAMVIVNTVVLARDSFGQPESAVALALGVSGAGSLITALALPRLLRRFSDRTVMIGGALLLPLGLGLTAIAGSYAALLAIWAVLGIGLAAVQTPTGRLVQRAAQGGDGPELFAAQFALSHACWLVTYPLAGALGSIIGVSAIAALLAGLSAVTIVVAARVWSRPVGVAAASAG